MTIPFIAPLRGINVTGNKCIRGKGLSKGVAPQGIRVVSVAPGFTETESAIALIERLAAQAGTDTTAARQMLMNASAAFLWAVPTVPRK